MEQNLHNTAPSDESFEDMKKCAIKLWKTYDNTFGYVDQKVNAIKDLENIGDNFMFIYRMFDWENQIKLVDMLKDKTWVELQERIKLNY